MTGRISVVLSEQFFNPSTAMSKEERARATAKV
jgi:hypothetical protein